MENNEKRGIWGGILSMTALVISCISIAICLGVRVEISSENFLTNKSEPKAEGITVMKNEENAPIYRAEVENGYVVIRDKSNAYVKTLGTPLKLMTPADREYFSAGVDIFSEEELSRIVDDFEN